MTTSPEMQRLKAADRMHVRYIFPCVTQIESARAVFGPSEVLQVELGPSYMSTVVFPVSILLGPTFLLGVCLVTFLHVSPRLHEC